MLAALALALGPAGPAAAAPGRTSRVSTDSLNHQANGDSFSPAFSAGGRYVAFASRAANLVPGDTNGLSDIFVKDRTTGVTVRVNVPDGRTQCAGGDSERPHISADGRFVVYDSNCTDLVPGDTNGGTDVFVHDRDFDNNGIFDEPGGVHTTRVSVNISGVQANNTSFDGNISADGQWVAFRSTATNLAAFLNGHNQTYLRNRTSASTLRLVSHTPTNAGGNDESVDPVLSADGRFVAYTSKATDLIGVDANGHHADIYLYDRNTNQNVLISVSSVGRQGDLDSFDPAIDASGSAIAFTSTSDNFAIGAGGTADVFLRNRSTGVTDLVSSTGGAIAADDANTDPAIDDTGTVVAFVSAHGTLGRVFVRDLAAGAPVQVDAGSNGDSRRPTISSDATLVGYDSSASNLVTGDTNGKRDVFVFER